MKRFIFWIIVSIILLTAQKVASESYLTEKEKTNYYNKAVLVKPEYHLFSNDDLFQLIATMVPEKYIAAFMFYSEEGDRNYTNAIRIYLLGLGQMESEWDRTRSNKRNRNGTYDWGYLMLNEGNIKNKHFMNIFGPLEEYKAQDDIELWLITCIRYFKYLYSRYGCDALYAYNAGERAYIQNRIPDITYKYKYRISLYVSDILSELYDIAKENRRLKCIEEIAMIKERLRLYEERMKERHEIKVLYKDLGDRHRLHSILDTPYEVKINYDPRRRFITNLVLRRFAIPTVRNNKMIENTL
jgi:hypothetical protein